MADGIPRVFLGSAVESLDVVEVLKDRLRSHAEVVAWNDESVFPPSQYLLDTLLGLARSFDFAVLIFGAEDELISRGEKSVAPRDNVIFELGLFMSQLDRLRTFVLRPQGKARYRVLSDLGGFTLLTHEGIPRTRKKSLSVDDKRRNNLFLQSALQNACLGIENAIKHHGRRKEPAAGAQLGPENVLDVGDKLFAAIEDMQSTEKEISVTNLAHDMGVTWPLLKTRLLDQKQLRNLTWKTLMIDPDSAEIKKLAGAGISTRIARSRIREMQWAGEELDRAQRDRSVRFECRIYPEIPHFHGFLLNTEMLFLTMSKVQRNGKLESASSPYWVFHRNTENQQLAHPIEAFQSWIDYAWKRAPKVR